MVEMITNAHGDDDKITRGELLCILRTMGKLLTSVRLNKHIFTPVCYYLTIQVGTRIDVRS